MVLLNEGSVVAKAVTVILFGTLMLLMYRSAGRQELPVRDGALLLIAVHSFAAALQPSGFTGIPFAATAAAGTMIILADVRQRKSEKQLEGLHE